MAPTRNAGHELLAAANRELEAGSGSGSGDVLVIRGREAAVVIECTGEHDLTTKDTILELLSRSVDENDLVVVDLSNADFIDSSFLHNLVLADNRAQHRGTKLRLQMGTADTVRKVLEISGLLKILTVAHTREEALRP